MIARNGSGDSGRNRVAFFRALEEHSESSLVARDHVLHRDLVRRDERSDEIEHCITAKSVPGGRNDEREHLPEKIVSRYSTSKLGPFSLRSNRSNSASEMPLCFDVRFSIRRVTSLPDRKDVEMSFASGHDAGRFELAHPRISAFAVEASVEVVVALLLSAPGAMLAGAARPGTSFATAGCNGGIRGVHSSLVMAWGKGLTVSGSLWS